MAFALVDTCSEASSEGEMFTAAFSVPGLTNFDLDLDPETTVRDVKRLAREMCEIEPEHMRLLYKDRLLRDSDTVGDCGFESGVPFKVLFTAGHESLEGGGKPQVVP